MANLTVPVVAEATNDNAPPPAPVASNAVVADTPPPVAAPPVDEMAAQADEAVKAVINGEGQPPKPTMQSSVAMAITTNPDAEAEARRVAMRTGVPVETVFAQPDEMKRKVALDDINFDTYQKLYPTSALALSDVELAKIAHDDTENMGYLENTLRGIGGRAVNVGAGLARFGYGIDKTIIAGIAPDLVDFADSLSDLPGSQNLQAAEKFNFGYAPRTTWEDVKERPLMEFLPFALEQGLVSAPDMAAAIFAPGPYFLALTGEFGQNRAENDQRKEATVGDFIAAAPAAAANALLERFATKGIIGIGDVAKGFKQVGKAIAISALKEGSTEAFQNAAQYASETVGTKKGFDPAEAVDQAIQGFVGGAPFGAAFRGASEGVKAVTDRTQRKIQDATAAEQNARDFEKLNELASTSKLKERDPLAFQNFIEQIAQTDGAVENVYVDPKALAQAGISLETLSEASPSIAESARVAIEIGGDIKIPVSEYASHLAGTELGQSMIDHLKTNPLGMSRAEAQEFMQSHSEQLKADVEKAVNDQGIENKIQDSVDAVHKDLLGKLTETNRFTGDVNQQYATLLSSFYKVQAERMGVTPEELYKQHPVDIKSVLDSGATLDQKTASKISDEIFGKYGVEVALQENKDALYLASLKASDKGQGDGTKAMKDIIAYADERGKRITLTPSTDFGGSSVKRLKDFYKRFGFVENKGKNKDFSTRDTMYREPKILKQSAQTETTAFKKWFGDSKVVDKDGRPLVVYHGRLQDSVEFSSSKIGDENDGGVLGAGFYFDTDTNVANFYAQGSGGNVLPAYVALRNPYIVKEGMVERQQDGGVWKAETLLKQYTEDHPEDNLNELGLDNFRENFSTGDKELGEKIKDMLEGQNYDGVIFEFTDGNKEVVAFKPTQIKSAIGNEGTYDPKNPNILKQGEEHRGSFNPDTNVITLLKNADLSTFLHESGHFFLETMNKLALDPSAPDSIRADMQATFDWLGVKDLAEWNSHDLEWQRDKHEQFARGFEAYLFEGKSPSIEMRSVFQRFRDWLKNVYRNLSALNVELSDEVRGVFDRMLATDNQIKETELARSFEPMFSDLRAAGMSPEEWQQYQELGLQATREATTELESRSMRDMKFLSNAKSRALKDLQREAAGRRRDIRDQVTKEIMAEPVNQAREFITKGKFELPDDAPQALRRAVTEMGMSSTKLSLPDLKEMYGEEANAPWRHFSTGKNGEAGKEGLHPDTVAEMFGFSSGDELVRALLAAENPKERIAALTDQRMLEKYGDLTNPEVMAQAADEAVHNEVRSRFVATELNALQKATGGRKILAEAAKRFANGMIDRLRIRDIQPSRYSAAESRAARAAAESFKVGGLAAAAVEKRNQLIQNYAARAAHDGLAEVEKALRYFKKFDKEGSRENIATSSLDQIDSLLERFDLRKSQSLKAIDKRKSLLAWKAEQEDIGLEPEIPQELLNEAMRKHYKDMTLEELRGLRDTTKQLEHIGRLKNKLLTAKDARDFKTIVDGMVASINLNANGRVVDNRTRATKADQAMRLFKGFVAQHRKIASLARELDGIKDGGPVWETLIRTMNDAGDKEASMREKATKDVAKLIKPLMAEGGKMGGKGQFFETIGKSLNCEERIGIALNMGNEGNMQRLLDGEGWTKEQLAPVLDTLTKADWDFVQNIWDFFETFRPEIGAKEKRVYGKEPAWINPSPVQTKFGELRGGYYPIKYDTRRSIAAEQHSDADAAKQQMKGAYTSATTRRSFTKTRADEVKGRPLLYAMDGLYNGVNEIIHDLSWHEWLIDANRLLKNKALDGAIRNGYGTDVVRQFKDAVRDIAGGEQPTGTSFEKAIGDLRGGAVVAGLGFNIVNTVINLTGVTNSIVRIGPKWAAMGVAKYAAAPRELTKEVHEKSDFMRLRSKTMLRELNEIQSQVRGKSRARSAMDTMMFAPLTMTQMAVDVPMWYGAYQRYLTEGNAEDRAIALADQSLLDAQSGGQVKDLAAIQRGGPMQKLFTTFYGYFNAAYNLGVERTKATNFKDPMSVLKLGGDYLMLYTVPAVMGTLIKNALVGGKDDWDPEKLASILANDQISYLMGLMVGLREVTGAVQTVAGVSPYTASYGGPAGLRFFQEFYNLATQIHQGEADDALRKSVINIAGIFFKLPAAQINRTVGGIEALVDGDTENPLAVVAGPPKK